MTFKAQIGDLLEIVFTFQDKTITASTSYYFLITDLQFYEYHVFLYDDYFNPDVPIIRYDNGKTIIDGYNLIPFSHENVGNFLARQENLQITLKKIG